MTTINPPRPTLGLSARRLPVWAPYVMAVAAVAIAFGAIDGGGALGGGVALSVVASVVFFLVILGLTARIVEGSRAARNRIATAMIYSAFALAALPLILVVKTLIVNGHQRLDATFFTHSNADITAFDSGGGIYHAIIGTIEQVGIAVLISVPLGLGGAIYIVEYGTGKLASTIRFFVDVMTGIPSIVAGLFVLSFWVLVVSPIFNDGQPEFSGFAASLALTVLMLPTITRSSEEMLRLVPSPLREASYALGIPKWKTILKVVLPTATTGIVTGVMLAIARAAGETAPVLLVAGATDLINTDPFSGQQESLSIYINAQANLASPYADPRAWTAALTLVFMVLALTVIAKLLARRNKLT
ncbi:MAG TPA: phosphate ABC transporter permease PstA [Micromonosporaceae bacterium]